MKKPYPLQDELYFVQNRVIKEIAEKESCVIVGRGADYILRDRGDCLHVFITADEKSKLERAVKYYTDQEWGMASNYDLCLNSGLLGIEGCVKIIRSVFESI